jgi:hypothetical protein
MSFAISRRKKVFLATALLLFSLRSIYLRTRLGLLAYVILIAFPKSVYARLIQIFRGKEGHLDIPSLTIVQTIQYIFNSPQKQTRSLILAFEKSATIISRFVEGIWIEDVSVHSTSKRGTVVVFDLVHINELIHTNQKCLIIT